MPPRLTFFSRLKSSTAYPARAPRQTGSAASARSTRAAGRHAVEGVHVEPLIHRRIVGHDVVDAHAIGEQEVAEPERRAALRLEDVADLPATEHGVGHAAPAAPVAAVAAERQLHETARHERVLAIPLADHALERRVEIVQVSGFGHRARPGVRDLHGKSVRHAPLDARLQRLVVGLPVGLGRLDRGELRIRTQQLAARHVRAGEPRAAPGR